MHMWGSADAGAARGLLSDGDDDGPGVVRYLSELSRTRETRACVFGCVCAVWANVGHRRRIWGQDRGSLMCNDEFVVVVFEQTLRIYTSYVKTKGFGCDAGSRVW